ncbi:MAG: hypothetical protein ACR2NZ_03085 [Rubripirellula sp.]
MHFSYVRIGALAEVHVAECSADLSRGRRVIVRTDRGVELGEVIRPANPSLESASPPNNSSAEPAEAPSARKVSTAVVLRPTTQEDELLIRRLERHKREAVEACRDSLAKAGSTALLLDVDQLFDGGTLVMHFLGPVDEVASTITREVSDRYESIVRSRHFAKLLSEGCGPDCGQKEGGCGGGCAGCAASAACQTH